MCVCVSYVVCVCVLVVYLLVVIVLERLHVLGLGPQHHAARRVGRSPVLSNAQRGHGMGERGLRTKPGLLEPCGAEKNKGSDMQWGS